jgi:hypothetical protein
LWVDGVRFPDGEFGSADPSTPIALDDLRVVWGRSNSLDQPHPATCSFTVLDRAGGQRYRDVLRIGAAIAVRADATIYPDPSVSTIPALLPGPVAGATVTGTATSTTIIGRSPAHTDQQISVIYPPAAYSADPSSWDAVPRAAAGQAWRLLATITLPAVFAGWSGHRAVVQPVAFSTPTGKGYQLLGAGQTLTASGTVDLTFIPPAGVWLGLSVRFIPPGPAWSDLDSTPWSDLAATPTWHGLVTYTVSAVSMLAPATGAVRSGAVFAGRITDLTAKWSAGPAAATVAVIAQDDTAELANRYVGDAPWPAEALSARAGRIVAAAGQQTALTIDPAVQAVQVSRQDVDAQPATDLLGALAQSVGGVLWSATSMVSGPFLRIEDVASRTPLFALVDQSGTGAGPIVIAVAPAPPGSVQLSACSVELDPVEWNQDTQDIATQVAITWKDQTSTPDTTDRIEQATDPVAEAAVGRRRLGVSTMLSTQPAAAALASQLLARMSIGGWRIAGLTWQAHRADTLDPATLAAMMTILDAATRLGLPIMLTDVPSWSPVANTQSVPLYLEGATLTNAAGYWSLDLVTSSASAQGPAAVAWQDLPAAWSWSEFDPSIAWSDLAGVTVPTG